MKKLLVVLFAAMMIVSVAAAAMASVTVKGDFRYEFIADSALKKEAAISDKQDLRVQIDGQVSDTVGAYVTMRANTAGLKPGFYADDYYFSFKQSFGTIKLGSFDWKTTPSRVLIKSNGFNIIPRSEVMFTVDVPFESGLYAGLAYELDGEKADGTGATNDGANDIKIGFQNDMFGAEVHLGDLAIDEATYTSYDFYYNVMDGIKVYLYNNTWKDGDAENIIGVQFANIADSGLKASIEYGIDPNGVKDAKGDEWNQMAVQLVYTFTNKLSFEFEHNNYMAVDAAKLPTEVETKNVLRARVKF